MNASQPSGSSGNANGSHHGMRNTKMSMHKIVLPAANLPDVAQDEEGRACLDPGAHGDGFFYIPNFISESEEAYLIEKIRNAPQPKWKALHARSGQLLGRLQHWGGQLNKQALIPEPMPEWLTQFPPLLQRVSDTGAFEGSKHSQFNHCLVNEYEPGQGIMPHEDGGAYFPAVATISLGAHTLLDIYRYAAEAPPSNEQGQRTDEQQPSARAREQEPRFSILQERRSLLITKGSACRLFLHGIAERLCDEPHHLAAVTNGDMIVDTKLAEHVRSAKAAQPARPPAHKRPKIEATQVDALPRTLRLSLTLRDVEKVASKSLLSLLAKR